MVYNLGRTPAPDSASRDAVLRSYILELMGYIDERLLSKITGISRHRIYEILVMLAQRRIIRYKPSKKTPLITFTRQRVLAEELRFEKEVYDERKESFEQRIISVLNYAQSNDTCRSKMLLAYFGEKEPPECGTCDICIQKRRTPEESNEYKSGKEKIMKLLANRAPHSIAELENLQIPTEILKSIMRNLADEEIIEIVNGNAIKLK